MFNRKDKISAFKTLSDLLLYNDNKSNEDISKAMMSFQDALFKSNEANVWFTKDNLDFMVNQIGKMLENENLEHWLKNYPEKIIYEPKTVGVVMAGNIPMAGFHDFICVLMSGHHFLGKLSHDDQLLLPALANLLCTFDNRFREMITFTTEKLSHFDAIIATGSDNTSRYFDYYFGKYPNIIRKNRNGLAVLKGDENKNDYEQLAKDVFIYFGLGCRSVSSLLVPEDFDFKPMLDVFGKYEYLRNHARYFNNYEYNKAVCLIEKIPHYDTDFLIVRESNDLSSPLSVLHYQKYSSMKQVESFIEDNNEVIQCVVCKNAFLKNSFDFGQAQEPKLSDYADGIDTMKFLFDL